MIIRRRSAAPWKHAPGTYRRRALTHYSQTAALLIPILGFAMTMSLAAAFLLLIGAEMVVLLTLPNLVAFRQRVDSSLELAECASAAAPRAALLARMSEAHRRELDELEALAERVGTMVALEVDPGDEWLGLDDLLSRFVRLAIAHRECISAFDADGDRKLAVQIAALERTQAVAAPGEASAWAARRLAIFRHRRETWDDAQNERALLSEEIATIAELVRWTHEQVALGHSAQAHAGLVEAVGSCAENGAALRELSALEGSRFIDPQVLRRGRRAQLESEREREWQSFPVRVAAPVVPAAPAGGAPGSPIEAALRVAETRAYPLPPSYDPVGIHDVRVATG